MLRLVGIVSHKVLQEVLLVYFGQLFIFCEQLIVFAQSCIIFGSDLCAKATRV